MGRKVNLNFFFIPKISHHLASQKIFIGELIKILQTWICFRSCLSFLSSSQSFFLLSNCSFASPEKSLQCWYLRKNVESVYASVCLTYCVFDIWGFQISLITMRYINPSQHTLYRSVDYTPKQGLSNRHESPFTTIKSLYHHQIFLPPLLKSHSNSAKYFNFLSHHSRTNCAAKHISLL